MQQEGSEDKRGRVNKRYHLPLEKNTAFNHTENSSASCKAFNTVISRIKLLEKR